MKRWHCFENLLVKLCANLLLQNKILLKKLFFFDIEYGCPITPISSEKFTANIENPTQGKKISTSNFHHVVKTIP